MKFPVEQCECGLDLTTAIPIRVRLGAGPNGEPIGGCPNCWRTYFMVEEAPEPAPPPPRARGRRGASEPEPVAEPSPEPEAPAEEAPPAEPVEEVPPPEPAE